MHQLLLIVVTIGASIATTTAEPLPRFEPTRPATSTEAGVSGAEPIVGLPCEGCEAVFDGMPSSLRSPAAVSATPAVAERTQPLASPIAASFDSGARLRLSGTVRDAAGVTQPGIVLYAYQTDARGIYPAAGRLRGAAARHGGLRGWTRSDAMGRYAFDTVRPGAYPDGGEPQHIHLHVIEPRRCTYYIGDVLFADDPLLDAERRADAVDARGGSGIVAPYGDATRGWQATRDITLGLNVPGYDGCS